MSAAYLKRKSRHPSLPTELWSYILDLATQVPGTLEPEIYDVSRDPFDSFAQSRLTQLRRSLITKRSVVRVCKSWHALVSPILYRSLFIGSRRSLVALARTLVDSRNTVEKEGGKPRMTLGWRVQRLDVAMRDSSRDGPADLAILVEIVRSLPNLIIMNFPSRFFRLVHSHMPLLSTAISETCGASLRVLEWADLHFLDAPTVWDALLVAVPGLRTLRGPWFSLFPVYSLMDPFVGTLPERGAPPLLALESFRLFNLHALISDTNFPALREMEYCSRVGDVTQWLTIIEIHGHKLTTLSIYYDTRMAGLPLQQEMERVISWCPNLKRLCLSLDSWQRFVPLLVLPPVQYLSLRSSQLQSSARIYKELFMNFGLVVAPSLKVLRIANRQTCVDLRMRHAKLLAGAVAELSKRFRVEDYLKNPL